MDERIRLKQKHDLMFIDRAVARCKERETRTASAAWKASAKKWRKCWRLRAGYCVVAELDRDRWQLGYQQADKERMEERDKWISAEQRVAELESGLNKIMDKCHDLPVADDGFVIWTIASTALNKDQEARNERA